MESRITSNLQFENDEQVGEQFKSRKIYSNLNGVNEIIIIWNNLFNFYSPSFRDFYLKLINRSKHLRRRAS